MRSFSTLHILKYSVKASNGTINNNGLLGLHSGLFATQLWLFYNAICTGGYKNGFLDTGYRMKLSGVEQEILISNGDFDKSEFLLFFVLYSNGTVWSKIWRNEKEKNIQEHLERMGI